MRIKKNFGTFLAAAALLVGAPPAIALPVTGQGTWESTLQARDLNGDSITDAFYDTSLNVTWLANGNANGPMTWGNANTWASNLTVGIYDDWRLPTMVNTGSFGCDWSAAGGTDCGYNVQTAGSEMAHLWYLTLGNKSFCPPGDESCGGGPQAGWGLTNTANFLNLQSGVYWSGSEYAPDTDLAWYFSTSDGDRVPSISPSSFTPWLCAPAMWLPPCLSRSHCC